MARAWWIGIIAWMPILVGEAVRSAYGAPLDPTLFDLSVHVRLLFTLPILLHAEQLLEESARSAAASFQDGKFSDAVAVDRILARAMHLRDLWFVEIGLFVAALAGGQLVLWKIVGSSGLFHGGAVAGPASFPRLWYVVVALPLVHFVMYRWLWRWGIWTYVLARFSRLRLVLIPTHADRAAGLAALARPVTGFCGFVLGTSAILSSAWVRQVLEGETTIKSLIPELVTFLLVALALALGPLIVFCLHLYRARRRGLAQYGDFTRLYVRQFHEKWIVRAAENDQPLGSSDIQSLNDLGQSYEVVVQTRLFVFGPRTVLAVWFSGIVPMIPMFSTLITVEQVLRRIVKTILGGLPV
jgi:hypothetical protein